MSATGFAGIDPNLVGLPLFVEKTFPLNSFVNFVMNTWFDYMVVNPTRHYCH